MRCEVSAWFIYYTSLHDCRWFPKNRDQSQIKTWCKTNASLSRTGRCTELRSQTLVSHELGLQQTLPDCLRHRWEFTLRVLFSFWLFEHSASSDRPGTDSQLWQTHTLLQKKTTFFNKETKHVHSDSTDECWKENDVSVMHSHPRHVSHVKRQKHKGFLHMISSAAAFRRQDSSIVSMFDSLSRSFLFSYLCVCLFHV